MRFTDRDHLVIGLAPGPGDDSSRRVLESASGSRLAELAGTTLERLLGMCDTVNAYQFPWSQRSEAQARVMGLLVTAAAGDYESVLLLGIETCGFAGVRPPFAGTDNALFGLPHTSGLNRWWNDPANLERGLEVAQSWWRVVVDG